MTMFNQISFEETHMERNMIKMTHNAQVICTQYPKLSLCVIEVMFYQPLFILTALCKSLVCKNTIYLTYFHKGNQKNCVVF